MVMLEVWDECTVFPSPEVVAEASRKVRAFAARCTAARVSYLAGPDVGYEGPGKDWARVRPHDAERVDRRSSSGLIWHLAGADRFSSAGGPFMQQQAVLRANASGIGNPQRELQKKR